MSPKGVHKIPLYRQQPSIKLPWNVVYAKLRPYFMDRRGTRMASVPQMLTIMKVPKGRKQNLHRDSVGADSRASYWAGLATCFD